jgi:hypothetical protein
LSKDYGINGSCLRPAFQLFRFLLTIQYVPVTVLCRFYEGTS